MLRSVRMTLPLAMLALVGMAEAGHAQDFPNRPIRILVGAAPGRIDRPFRTYVWRQTPGAKRPAGAGGE
jgi:hypothetical protein